MIINASLNYFAINENFWIQKYIKILYKNGHKNTSLYTIVISKLYAKIVIHLKKNYPLLMSQMGPMKHIKTILKPLVLKDASLKI